MSNNKKNKDTISVGNLNLSRLSIVVIMLLVVVVGGTFAWFTYKSRETALVLSIGDIDDSKVIIKPYQIRKNMVPTNTYFSDDDNDTNDVFSQIIVINNGDNILFWDLYYRVNTLDETLINNGLKYTVVSSDSLDGEYTEVETNDFTNLGNNREIDIFNIKVNPNTTMYYRVYLWLDTNVGDQSAIQNLQLDIELNGMLKFDAEKPVLDQGMIPVVISNDGTVTTIDKDDSNWYNYNDKKWANIVLVNELATDGVEGSQSREYYLNNPGTTVLKSDILAYYVWIPRYSYKVWLMDGTTTSSPRTIDIRFESQMEEMKKATKVGEYMTHPAFWWDKNLDGEINNNEMLPGIWVGKFETTGTAENPTVLPNEVSLREQTVSEQFVTSLKFAGGSMNTSTGEVSFNGNDTYGLTSNIDSHMMKNRDWGAVVYLSHSDYGINQEIYVNNSSGFYTGRSGGNVKGSVNSLSTQFGSGSTTDQSNSYGYYTWTGQAIGSDGTIGEITDSTLGTKASTTGNITGVYDMSGGTYEYVMGHFGDMIDEDNDESEFTVLPLSKYYDVYLSETFTGDYQTNVGLCTLETCGGHALFETANWYNEYAIFVNSGRPWFMQGNYGEFSSSSNSGVGGDFIGFHSVLVPQFQYNVTFDFQGGEYESVKVYSTAGEHVYEVVFDGEYQLEVWGAQGGNASSLIGGYGGYSSGFIELIGGTELHVNVGGKGEDGSSSNTYYTSIGGYNGGGNGYVGSVAYPVGAGGGATHIALQSGELNTLSNYENKVLIVAGGGGGVSYYTSTNNTKTIGHGGGYIGVEGKGYNGSTYYYASGGTQISAGENSGDLATFGKGADSSASSRGGGGGGWYGGNTNTYSAGGGSGYIGNSLLTNKAMYCYGCTTSDEVNTLTYSTTNVSDGAISNYAKIGDGAAKITSLDILNLKKLMIGDLYGQLPVLTKYGYTFVGWNTESDGTGTWITSESVFDVDNGLTVYAIWEEAEKYTISYDANGGSGAPEAQEKYHGFAITLSDVKPTRNSYIFVGWAIDDSSATSPVYQPGDEFTINADTTLYAVWISNPLNSYSCSNGSKGSAPYLITYSGSCTVIDDGDGNWRVKLLSTGTKTLTFSQNIQIDAFLVGGGGGGGYSSPNGTSGAGGGGGGYTTTLRNVSVTSDNTYNIVIGSGGSTDTAGGSTSAFNNTVKGGGAGGSNYGGGGKAGVGLNNGGKGATTGAKGGNGGSYALGSCEFGEGTTSECTRGSSYAYSGGGGGGGRSGYSNTTGAGGAGGGGAGGPSTGGYNAASNRGGGGGGAAQTVGSSYDFAGGTGGSGIVVIRNAR